MAQTPPTARDWTAILILGLIWGSTFMFQSVALTAYPPVTIAALRTLLGAVAVLALVRILRRPLPRSAGVWAYVVPLGVVSTALPFFLLSWGQTQVPSAFAGLIVSAVPLFLLPLAHVFVPGEVIDWRKTLGVIVGFAGAITLFGPGVSGTASLLGQLACLAAAGSYAVSGVLTKRCPPVDPLVLAALALTVGSLILVPAMLLVDGLPGSGPTLPMLAILVLGLMPTALGAILRMQTIRRAGPVFMSLVSYQIPLWATLCGALILGERLTLHFFIALGLILLGLVISQGQSLSRLLRSRSP